MMNLKPNQTKSLTDSDQSLYTTHLGEKKLMYYFTDQSISIFDLNVML